MAQRRNAYLAAIAVFRLIKSAGCFAIGIGALRLLRPAVAQRFAARMAALQIGSEHALLHRAIAHLTHISPHRAGLIAATAFAYGAVMGAEGIGLWMQKRWAEWLTIVVTGSFIPMEIVEVVRRATFLRAGLLVINVVILVYLVVRRVQRR